MNRKMHLKNICSHLDKKSTKQCCLWLRKINFTIIFILSILNINLLTEIISSLKNLMEL